MVFEQVEELKRDYTDKYVVVDESRPELSRFKGSVGRVKTVNMSGRALVEFNAYDNIGWFDIDLDFLKVVDAPPPPAPEKKPAKEPAKKPSDEAPKAEAAVKTKAAAPSAAAKTTAEILAAARTKKGSAAPTAAPAKPAAAPAKPAAAAPAGKVDRAKLSVAEILAMARGGAAAAPKASAPAPEVVEEEVVQEAPAPVAAAESKPAPQAASGGDRPKPGELSVDQIVAWCRQHDAK